MKTKKETYLKCSFCEKVNAKSKWTEDSEECEVCGFMPGIACPECSAVFTDCSKDYPERVKNED